jgi:hypothetical protein
MKINLRVSLIKENLTIKVVRGKRTISKSGEIRVIKLEENSNDKKIERHVKSSNETKSK